MKLQHNGSGESSEDLISLIIALWRRHKEEEERKEASRGKRAGGRDVIKEVHEPGGTGVSPVGLSTLTPPHAHRAAAKNAPVRW